MNPSRIFSQTDIEAEYFSDKKVWTTLLTTGEHMQLVWAEFEPGGDYRLHSHPHEQISVMIKGRMKLTVGDEVREIGPGDMWHAPANVVHGGEILGDESVVFIDVYAPASESIKQRFEEMRTAG